MPKCTAGQMEFGRLGRRVRSRVLSADFDGGALSSDGGLMLLRQVDQRTGLSRAVASVLHDDRNPDRIPMACANWWHNGCMRCAVGMRISMIMAPCAAIP